MRLRPPIAALIGAASAVFVALLAPGPAGADPASPVSNAAPDAGLEEVIVYARRRSEKLADVPVAETVVSGAEIEAQNAITVEDALREIPNTMAFQSARSVSALEVTMRG